MSSTKPGKGTLVRRQWRDYRTVQGGRPIKKFMDALTDEEVADVVAAMKEVREKGKSAARHLRGEIYEVRASSEDRIFRMLFAAEGRYSQVLLSLNAFAKKGQKCPPAEIDLAERRLADWRKRGKALKN